ncbi:MAG: hypothetical protein WD825_17145 [Gemmatimonadaceae bacterium]
MKRLVPKASTGSVVAARKCPRCGNGDLRPDSDGNGGLVDRCTNCNAIPTASDRARAERAASAGRPCPAKDCRGKLNASGACEPCERRATWIATNLPAVCCEICTAEIPEPARSQKYCAACKPLRTRWYARQARERMAKKR